MPPIQFGLQLWPQQTTWPEYRDAARRVAAVIAEETATDLAAAEIEAVVAEVSPQETASRCVG